MGFGRQFKDFPTPESVVFKVNLLTKALSGIIIIMQPIEFNHVWKEVITGVLSTVVGLATEVQEYFGVKVDHMVKPKDIDVIKDESLKIIIFITLINIYTLL